MGCGDRIAVRKGHVKASRQRHTDVGTGQGFKFGDDPDRRPNLMPGDVKRQDNRVFISKVIKAEGIEALWQRPFDGTGQIRYGTCGQVDDRRQTRLARCPPVDLPAAGKREFNAKRQRFKVTGRGNGRYQPRLSDLRVAVPVRLHRIGAETAGKEQDQSADHPADTGRQGGLLSVFADLHATLRTLWRRD